MNFTFYLKFNEESLVITLNRIFLLLAFENMTFGILTDIHFIYHLLNGQDCNDLTRTV